MRRVNRQQLPLMFRGRGTLKNGGGPVCRIISLMRSTLFSLLCKTGLPETVGDDQWYAKHSHCHTWVCEDST